MAASYGSATFERPNGSKFIKDLYFDDAAGAAVRWDEGSGASATSSTFFTPREWCGLKDVVIVSATGQTKTQVNLNGIPSGTILRNSLHLAAIVTRPELDIVIPPYTELKLLQLA